MRISISGYGEHGKDTLAGIFKEITILNYTKSTSAYVKTEMFHHMNENHGAKYLNEDDCYNDRANHREIWAAYIDEFNKDDPAALYRRCLKDQDILTGVRRREEFEAVLGLNVIDLAIWIDRPNFHKNDTTQEYGPELCDIILLNDNILNLRRRVLVLAKSLNILKCQHQPHLMDISNTRCVWCGCPRFVLDFNREAHTLG